MSKKNIKRTSTSVDPFGISSIFGYKLHSTRVSDPKTGKGYGATDYSQKAADKKAGDGFRKGKRN